MTRGGFRRLALALLSLGVATAATASPPRPAEEPPADFPSPQYIDSAGCVFTRQGKSWAARLGRDGSLVCGYPPTPVTGVQALTSRQDVPLDGMGRIEADLVTAVTAGMEAGDLRADAERNPRYPPGSTAEVAASSAGGNVQQSLSAAIAAAPQVGNAVAAGLPRANPRLCALLGLGAGPRLPSLGGDPTGGYCSGLAAPALTPRIAAVEGAARDARDVPASAASPTQSRRPKMQVARVTATAATPPAKVDAQAEGAPAARQRHPSTEAALVPAGTRFLELGTYADEHSAEAALRAAARLGLPVARGRAGKDGRRSVLVGPFETREAVVRAHDRLGRAGFAGLLPRR